jgi:hypothetical protein
MSNHLFIGLGGTGCAVVRELKKLLFVEWRRKGGTGLAPDIYEFKDNFGGMQHEVRIATLSVDSNDNDLNGHLDKWRVLGEQISLRPNEKVLLTPQGLGNVMANLQRYPGIEPWIGHEREQVDSIIRGTDQPNGCNQIRRLGRLALANGNNLQNLIAAFTDRRRALGMGGTLDVSIHIACTTGCGTGSGTLVDTITQLRRVLANEQGRFPIHLYLFATAGDVGAVNAGNFYANQYAALQELNALRLGLYRPWDISGSGGQSRIGVKDPFESAFIITEATESGQGLQLKEQVTSTAEFVFQKTVRLMGNVPPRLQMVHTFEDVAQYATDAPDSDRSTRFASFGVKRFAIPEQEIHEKMAYSFVSQAVRRMLYNNWSGQNGAGYVAAPRDLSADGFVEKRKETWGLTEGRLNSDVDRPAQAEDPYPVFVEDWTLTCGQLAAEVKVTFVEDTGAWIPEFDAIIEEYWRNGFRGKGVENYFGVRREANALVNRARHLVGSVEQDLLRGMENLLEEYQAHHFPEIIRKAKTHLEIAMKNFHQELKDLSESVVAAQEDAERNRAEFENVGFLGKKMGRHITIFDAYVKARQDYYCLETFRHAAEYALKVIGTSLPEFGHLELRADEFVRKMKKIDEDHQNLVLHRIVEKPDGAVEDATKEVIPYVNVREVNESIEKLITDKATQDASGRVAVDALRSLRRVETGDGFERYNELAQDGPDEKIVGEVVRKITGATFPFTREVHERRRLSDNRFVPILGQNIVEKLCRDYAGQASGGLAARIKKFMDVAMPAASFDGGATPIGHFGVSSPIFARSVFLPQWEGPSPDFRDQLKQLIGGMTDGGVGGRVVPVEVVDVPVSRNPTEIVFLSVAYFFPLRMLRTVHGLHSKHAERLLAGPAAGEFQIYTETHRPILPVLTMPDAAEIRDQTLPYLLLAELFGLIQVPDSQNGNEVVLLAAERAPSGRLLDPLELDRVTCTTEDRDIYVKEGHLSGGVSLALFCLVKRFRDQFRMVNPRPLQGKLAARLSDVRSPDQKKALMAQLEGLLDSLFILRNRNENDPVYQYYSKGVGGARQLIENNRA